MCHVYEGQFFEMKENKSEEEKNNIFSFLIIKNR